MPSVSDKPKLDAIGHESAIAEAVNNLLDTSIALDTLDKDGKNDTSEFTALLDTLRQQYVILDKLADAAESQGHGISADAELTLSEIAIQYEKYTNKSLASVIARSQLDDLSSDLNEERSSRSFVTGTTVTGSGSGAQKFAPPPEPPQMPSATITTGLLAQTNTASTLSIAAATQIAHPTSVANQRTSAVANPIIKAPEGTNLTENRINSFTHLITRIDNANEKLAEVDRQTQAGKSVKMNREVLQQLLVSRVIELIKHIKNTEMQLQSGEKLNNTQEMMTSLSNARSVLKTVENKHYDAFVKATTFVKNEKFIGELMKNLNEKKDALNSAKEDFQSGKVRNAGAIMDRAYNEYALAIKNTTGILESRLADALPSAQRNAMLQPHHGALAQADQLKEPVTNFLLRAGRAITDFKEDMLKKDREPLNKLSFVGKGAGIGAAIGLVIGIAGGPIGIPIGMAIGAIAGTAVTAVSSGFGLKDIKALYNDLKVKVGISPKVGMTESTQEQAPQAENANQMQRSATALARLSTAAPPSEPRDRADAVSRDAKPLPPTPERKVPSTTALPSEQSTQSSLQRFLPPLLPLPTPSAAKAPVPSADATPDAGANSRTSIRPGGQ